jgi:glucose-6-phosphate isomerase
MTAAIKPLIKRPAWKSLAAHHKDIKKMHLRELFTADSKRGERMTAEAVGLFLDYSKNRITDETLGLLLDWRRNPACASASMPCSVGEKST